MQHLRSGNLRQTNGGDIANIATKGFVHLFIHALRFHRHVVEMGFAQQSAFALLAVGDPFFTTRQTTRFLHLLRHFNQQCQRRFSIRDNAEIRTQHATNLRRLNIDMNDFAPFGVFLYRTGMTVSKTVTDTKHHVGRQQRCVTVTMRGLQTHHPGHQFMIVRDTAPAHQRWDHRNAGQFSKLL